MNGKKHEWKERVMRHELGMWEGGSMSGRMRLKQSELRVSVCIVFAEHGYRMRTLDNRVVRWHFGVGEGKDVAEVAREVEGFHAEGFGIEGLWQRGGQERKAKIGIEVMVTRLGGGARLG